MKWSVVVILCENNVPFANSRVNGNVGSFWECQSILVSQRWAVFPGHTRVKLNANF